MCGTCGEITGEVASAFAVPLDHWNAYDIDGFASHGVSGGVRPADVVRDHTALLTGDDEARWNGLTDEGAPAVVTYRFLDDGSMPAEPPSWSDFANDGYVPFDARQEAAFRDALDLYAEAAGLTFLELGAGDERAMIGVSRTTGSQYGGWAEFPFVYGDFAGASHLVLDGRGSFAPGTWEFEILLHEIGHAVGLKHPFDADLPNRAVLAADLDTTRNTVMSYEYGSAPRRELGRLDEAALEQLYGGADGTQGWRALATDRAIVLRAGPGDDVLTNPNGWFTLYGGDGDDRLVGTGGANGGDRQYGQGGRDRLEGGGGDDALFGGSGADRIEGGWGDDLIEGGSGADRIDGDGPEVPAGAGGTRDVIRGGAGGDRIDAGEGNDRAWGEGHADVILGRSGNDRLWGGGGADRLGGGEGDDRLRGGAGRDDLAGGAGRDRLWGDGGADTLEGGAGADVLLGGAMGDTLRGGGGADRLDGQRGDDLLVGGAGDDALIGGAGRDDLRGSGGGDRLDGGRGADVLDGGTGADTLLGRLGRDALGGGRGRDDLDGGGGADRLSGGGGNDVLAGGGGRDRIDGGRGADTIAGGGGRDVLTGGAGRDVFVFGQDGRGVDRITDWQGRLDAIDLAALDGPGRGPRIFERADGDAMLFYGDLKVRIEDADAGDFAEGSFLL